MATERFLVLSPREKQLLRRSAQGKTDREIAQEIGVTESQVVRQRQSLIKKLQIQSDAQLTTASDELAPSHFTLPKEATLASWPIVDEPKRLGWS